jgi:hypothetical protein
MHSVYLIVTVAFVFPFGDAGTNLVLFEGQADELVVNVGWIWELEEGHEFVCWARPRDETCRW